MAEGGTQGGTGEAEQGPSEEASFEQVLERLQAVVERLEQGDMPLEQSLASFEEGIRLSRLGARRLDEAERRVEQLLETDEGVSTRPMDKEPDS
jgi:exodeoxyribonuclease VII small subunit